MTYTHYYTSTLCDDGTVRSKLNPKVTGGVQRDTVL